MKHFIHILLILTSFDGMSQFNVEEQQYIDSLNNIISQKNTPDTLLANTYVNLSEILYQVNFDTLKVLSEKVKFIAEQGITNAKTPKEKISLQHSLASALNNLGYYCSNIGQVPKALDYYDSALKNYRQLGDKKGTATSLNNIGSIYHHQNDYENALKAYLESLKLREEINDRYDVANSLSNLASVYSDLGKNEIFLEYSTKSLAIREEIGDKMGIASSLNNMAVFYEEHDDVEKALSIYYKSLKIAKEIGYKDGEATSLSNIGETEFKRGNLKEAKKYAKESMLLGQEIGFPGAIHSAARLLSMVYEKEGNYNESLQMYKLAITMRDSINNEENQKASAQQQAKYEYEKQKAVDDAAHEKLIAIEQEAKSKQKVITYATAGGLGLVVIFLVFVFNRLQVTKKQKIVIEAQKLEVEQQKEVVELAHNELEEKNQEITDSIQYAKRIQNAILPPLKVVKEYLQESFILYKPKDIVAGDFYWLESVTPTGKNKETKILFAAADCTGHGVPGAMVSVVCNNGLNRSVREFGLTDPGEILNKTREIVIAEFEKSEDEVKDGMDIALCSLTFKVQGLKLENETLNPKTETAAMLQYAGANNPLWIIRNNEIIETKADKQPIGKFDELLPYTTHTFELQKGDSIYIFSDGYVDQFGGEKGKKFKAAAFRTLLLSIQSKPMEEQQQIINKTFENWKGGLEQIDDVCVIGVRI